MTDAKFIKPALVVPYQAVIGIGLAVAIISAWVALLLFMTFGPVRALGWSILAIAAQSWLTVGLFIIAHDAIHGSLAPGHRGINVFFGKFCLTIYAAFSYDKLRDEHFKHHAHVGTAGDPDFDDAHPRSFGPWFVTFMTRYSTWHQPVYFAVGSIILVGIFKADPLRVALFWMVPALLSSVQLFYFGTYLPHRIEDAPFPDQHKARTMPWPWLVTLFTCFHFGRHHEHHAVPHVPWWRLPSVILRDE